MHYDYDPDDKPEDYPDFWPKNTLHPKREVFTISVAAIIVMTFVSWGLLWIWRML